MPFTGSHPAAVLPLLGTPLPASALVIGSTAPDLPYYLPVSPHWPTHSAVGVVTIDLLIGAVAWVVWHALLTAPALAASPVALRGRLVTLPLGVRRRVRDLRDLGLLAAALVIGSATHVLWDEFTHPGRWGTQHLQVLADDWGGRPGYAWAQYASGALGALAVAWWLVAWWRGNPAVAVPATPTWRVLPCLALVGAVVGGAAALRTGHLRAAGFAGATRGGAAMAVCALLLALVWHVRAWQQDDRLGPG